MSTFGLRKRLGNRLRLLRKADRLTQEELASRAGFDPKYLGAVERGQENISLDRIEKLASVLRVDPSEFLQPDTPPIDAPLGEHIQRTTLLLRRSDESKRRLMLQLLEDVSSLYGRTPDGNPEKRPASRRHPG
jgi:transcriptional regulator with XRE-family HTH domain